MYTYSHTRATHAAHSSRSRKYSTLYENRSVSAFLREIVASCCRDLRRNFNQTNEEIEMTVKYNAFYVTYNERRKKGAIVITQEALRGRQERPRTEI